VNISGIDVAIETTVNPTIKGLILKKLEIPTAPSVSQCPPKTKPAIPINTKKNRKIVGKVPNSKRINKSSIMPYSKDRTPSFRKNNKKIVKIKVYA
jgi:hypothetical protein